MTAAFLFALLAVPLPMEGRAEFGGGVVERQLVPVATPFEAPMHVDRSTIVREGALVTFTYVLQASPGSNVINAAIDCEARTYKVGQVSVYSKPRGEGTVRVVPEPPEAQRRMKPIPERSSWDYLAHFVCAA